MSRIFKNTLFLYARMFFVLLISLYTSRIVLSQLGVVDFGIYNVVAGVTSLLLFFTSSLSNASQRFISVSLGIEDIEGARRAFNLSLEIYMVLAAVLVIISESAGLWFVNNKLVIPPSRLIAANWVFQFTVVTAVITILQVPYLSVIIAEEQMTVYAYMGIFDACMKLLIVYLLQSSCDKLILYAFMMMMIEICCTGIYILYCRRFEECHIRPYWNKSDACELIGFISCTAYGCLAWSVAYQGATIVLNLFFGPVVNAARAIAMQINNALNNFSSAIVTAVKPQIIKSYSANELDTMRLLFLFSSKVTLILFVLMAIPVVLNIDFILSIWLQDVPDYTNIFTCLIVVDSMIASLIQPIGIAVNATGKIKNMQVYGRTITLLSLPVSYLLYRFQIVESPNVIFVILIVADLLYFLYSFNDLNRLINIKYKTYFIGTVLPVLLCLLVSVVLIACLPLSSRSEFVLFFEKSILSIILMSVFTFAFALSSKERKYITEMVRSRI